MSTETIASDRHTVTYEQPNAAALNASTATFLAEVEGMTIDSPPMYEIGAEALQTIKGRSKALDEQRLSITRPIDAAKTAVMNLFRGPLATLAQAETTIKRKLVAYDEEQRRLAEIERKNAEAAANAERERLAKEARDAEAAAEKLRNEAAAAVDPRQATQLAARAAVAQDFAHTAATAAEIIVAAPVVIQEGKARGISTSRPWKAEVTDKSALILWVAQDVAARAHFLDANVTTLTAQAKATRENTKIEGVRVYQDVVMSARAA